MDTGEWTKIADTVRFSLSIFCLPVGSDGDVMWTDGEFTWHPVTVRECADSLPLHPHPFLKTAQQRCVVRAVFLSKCTFKSPIYRIKNRKQSIHLDHTLTSHTDCGKTWAKAQNTLYITKLRLLKQVIMKQLNHVLYSPLITDFLISIPPFCGWHGYFSSGGTVTEVHFDYHVLCGYIRASVYKKHMVVKEEENEDEACSASYEPGWERITQQDNTLCGYLTPLQTSMLKSHPVIEATNLNSGPTTTFYTPDCRQYQSQAEAELSWRERSIKTRSSKEGRENRSVGGWRRCVIRHRLVCKWEGGKEVKKKKKIWTNKERN